MKYPHIVIRDGVWYPAGAEVPDGEPLKAELTDDVPDGAMEPNPDGSTNVYDADGNVVGTISEEEAERLAGEAWQVQNSDVAEPEKPKRGRKPKEA